MTSRRSFLASGALVLGAPFLNRGRCRLYADSRVEYSTRTLDLVRRSTVIDMLGLLTLDYRKLLSWEGDPARFQTSDFEKLRKTGITIFHPAVGHLEGDLHAASWNDIAGWNRFLSKHCDQFLRVDNAGDVEKAKELGKIGIVIGQQNSGHFRSVEDVDRFYAMGQRVSQLTYRHNRLGGGSMGQDSGLSAFGAEIVGRMNKLGMAVDVSHCGDRTTLDAVTASVKPVLVTHSNCRALVPNVARCKTDEAIRKMADKGGVFGVTMVRTFVRAGGPTTMAHVLDHIDHIVRVAGIEHAGVGSDVDLRGRDAAAGPRRYDLDGQDYGRKIYDLTEGLVRRNYTDPQIEMILGGNFERALKAIW